MFIGVKDEYSPVLVSVYNFFKEEISLFSMKILYNNSCFQLAKAIKADGDELYNVLDYYDIQLDESYIYIHFMPNIMHWQPKKCIIYLVDTEEERHKCLLFQCNLRSAHIVYDFSPMNIRKLRKLEINAHYKPIKYHPSFHNLNHPPKLISQRTNAVVFIGLVNTRRLNILNMITANKPPFRILIIQNGHCFDEELEKVMVDTVMCLNINQYDNGGFAALRVVPMVTNRVRVLSEHSSDQEMDDTYNNIVDWIYPHILETPKILIQFIYNCFQTTTKELLDKRFDSLKELGEMSSLSYEPVDD